MDDDEFDEFYEDDDPCDHDDYDVDILTGRAHCHRCGEAWWLTSEQLQAELLLSAQLAEAYALECESEDRCRLESEEMDRHFTRNPHG